MKETSVHVSRSNLQIKALEEALEAAHYYIDATDQELAEDVLSREDALMRARYLHASYVATYGHREARYGCVWCGYLKKASDFPENSPPRVDVSKAPLERNPHVVGICQSCQAERERPKPTGLMEFFSRLLSLKKSSET